MGRRDNFLDRAVGLLATVACVGMSVAACDRGTQETADTATADFGEVGDTPAAVGAMGGTPEAESYLADTGFRPNKHGFPFANGDRDPKTRRRKVYPYSSMGFYDVDAVVRMFGQKKVCMSMEDGVCNLTPPASEFMDTVNRKLNGGQCEGMAVGSMTLYKGYDKVSVFSPTAKSAFDLKRDDVRGMLGYYWAYQMVDPYKSHWRKMVRSTTPNETLDKIIASFQKGEALVMAFWAPPQPGRYGRPGHAVAPYAVEDRGNGQYWVRIYDNNFPGVSRYVKFDKNKNTWRYDVAAVNPDSPKRPWFGDASIKGIIATKIEIRLEDAKCHFCPDTQRQIRQVWLSGSGRATITDKEGNKVGYDEDGKWVNTIKNALAIHFASYMPGEPPPAPVLEVPAGEDYEIEIHGTSDKESEEKSALAVFGEGTALAISDIDLKKGDRDVVGISKDNHGISYESSRKGKEPVVKLALGKKDGQNFVLKLDKLELGKGKRARFKIHPKKLSFKMEGVDRSKVKLAVTRFNSKGKRFTFKGKALKLGGKGLNLGKLKMKKPDEKPDDKPKPKPKFKTKIAPKPKPKPGLKGIKLKK